MIAIKDEITMELEKIPQDKFAEIYDIIHFFRLGVENERNVVTDRRKGVLNFFGIWNDMSFEEMAVLDEIQSRRKRTFRERNL